MSLENNQIVDVQKDLLVYAKYIKKKYPNLNDIEDCIQDTNLKLMELRSRWDSSGSAKLSHFAKRVFDNILLAARKKHSIKQSRYRPLEEDIVYTKNQTYEYSELPDKYFNNLTEKQKEVIFWYCYSDLSLKEISRMLGLADSAARHRFNGAIKKLRLVV